MLAAQRPCHIHEGWETFLRMNHLHLMVKVKMVGDALSPHILLFLILKFISLEHVNITDEYQTLFLSLCVCKETEGSVVHRDEHLFKLLKCVLLIVHQGWREMIQKTWRSLLHLLWLTHTYTHRELTHDTTAGASQISIYSFIIPQICLPFISHLQKKQDVFNISSSSYNQSSFQVKHWGHRWPESNFII